MRLRARFVLLCWLSHMFAYGLSPQITRVFRIFCLGVYVRGSNNVSFLCWLLCVVSSSLLIEILGFGFWKTEEKKWCGMMFMRFTRRRISVFVLPDWDCVFFFFVFSFAVVLCFHVLFNIRKVRTDCEWRSKSVFFRVSQLLPLCLCLVVLRKPKHEVKVLLATVTMHENWAKR